MSYGNLPTSDSPQVWCPTTLSTKSLVSFICLCLSLILCNAIIWLGCATDGCHVFGKCSSKSIPPESDFVYSKLPAVLGVGLSLLWIVPHHDIVRLEPYFRMSAKDGEKASASLFLDYQYSISLFLPFKALGNKHWVVALSSIILCLMNFLIVPMLPNIFDMSVVLVNGTQISFDLAGYSVSPDISFSAYDRAWNNGTLFPFITDTYALRPVRPEYVMDTLESWTVETTLFEAELQCQDSRPPEVGYVDNNLTVNVTSADGVYKVHLCDAGALRERNQSSDACDAYTVFISPWTSISHQLSNTEKPASYMFAWASGLSPQNITENFTFPRPINITAIFCTPSYYSEEVNATIRMPSGVVLDVSRSGRRERITGPGPRGFDDILGGRSQKHLAQEVLVQGVPTDLQVPVRFGYPLDEIASIDNDLTKRFSRSDTSSVVQPYTGSSMIFMTQLNTLSAFSLFGHTKVTLGSLLDGRVLESTHDKGLKMLFAFALARDMSAELIVTTARITVNRGWALAVIIILSIVVLLAVSLAVLIRQRPCNLDVEPESLGASLRLLSASPELCTAMRWAEYYRPSVLSKAMDDANLFFKLELEEGPAIRVICGTENINKELLLDPGSNRQILGRQPWTLTATISAACFVYFPAMMILLIFSFANSRVNDGFPMPVGPNSFRSKILFTYLPIVLGSTIEPILVSLGATYCMIGPYRALRTGMASYSSSLAIDYDKHPPHLQLHASLRNREYTLSILSVAILLSNTLPIALVGLYSSSPYTPKTRRAHNIHQNIIPHNTQMYRELGRSLKTEEYPTWTTQEFYISPPYDPAPNGEGVYNTIGFGLDISCTQIDDNRITFPCSQNYSSAIDTDCASLRAKYSQDNFLVFENPCGLPQNPSLLSWDGTCMDSMVNRMSCADRIFPIWAENERFNVTPAGGADSYRFVALNCSLADRIVDLRTTVRNGQVLSVENIRPLDTQQISSLYAANMSNPAPLSLVFGKLLRTAFEFDPTLHPLARINHLMVAVNTSVVRVPGNETHLPDREATIGTFETVMRGLFATLLRMNAERIFGTSVEYVEGYRVYVGEGSFVAAMVMVLFSWGVVSVFYVGQNIMGHLPYTLAGMYSHLYESNVKDDMYAKKGKDLKEIEEDFEGRRYGYGIPEGSDHYGVYRVNT